MVDLMSDGPLWVELSRYTAHVGGSHTDQVVEVLCEEGALRARGDALKFRLIGFSSG